MARTVTSPPAQDTPTDRSRSSLRSICDSLIALGVAIVLVRGFLVEGYLIPTGSMAPHLYGEHKQVTCPSCGTQFAVGTEFDESAAGEPSPRATCPNCLRGDIDIADLPVDRGDHLLVWKNAYEWRDPRRWEVVVFRNPDTPAETYIKRAAGLPGETIQIRGGNLFANGEIARKPLELQRAMLIEVNDSAKAPQREDENWSPRWTPRDGDSRWTRRNGGFAFAPAAEPDPKFGWLDYRHTVRRGGTHEARIVLSEPLTAAQRSELLPPKKPPAFGAGLKFPGVRYDPDANALFCRGVMIDAVRRALLSIGRGSSLSPAVAELDRLSRVGRVNDFLAYNHLAGTRTAPVQEFLWQGDVTAAGGTLILAVRPLGEEFECRFDFKMGSVSLRDPARGAIVREGSLPPGGKFDGRLEVSTIDRQICVAIDGSEVFDPWPLDGETAEPDSPEVPISVGAAGNTIEIRAQRLFRDVYYTGGSERHGIREPLTLGEEEFFMLGDNSPVSADSRSWQDPAVPRKLLVGKPFLVHLPSRTFEFGTEASPTRIRIPDWSRIRFVR